MVLFEVNARSVLSLELERYAPRTVDVNRVADRIETSQRVKVEARDVHILSPLSGVEGVETGKHALVLGSRTHLYEGKGVRRVVHGMRTAAATGASVVVLTNGCGGLKPAWGPGTPVLISDHINLTAASPLEGATFVDLTDLYSPRLRELARSIQPDLDEGVYVQFRGPQYETPAEVRMARTIGGHIVGMSTALEAIAARQAGMEILGFSLITNLAAGISPVPLSHAEVLQAGKDAEPVISELLARVVAAI